MRARPEVRPAPAGSQMLAVTHWRPPGVRWSRASASMFAHQWQRLFRNGPCKLQSAGAPGQLVCSTWREIITNWTKVNPSGARGRPLVGCFRLQRVLAPLANRARNMLKYPNIAKLSRSTGRLAAHKQRKICTKSNGLASAGRRAARRGFILTLICGASLQSRRHVYSE